MKDKYLFIEKLEVNPAADWVVFVHGAGGSSRTWRKQVEAFRPHFNLCLLDLRDHGESNSMAPPEDGKYTLELMGRDVIATLEAEGITQAHFVGVSLGSVVVRYVERIQPGLVTGVVLAGGVFRLNWRMKSLLKLGLATSKVLPFKTLYQILSWIVLPRRNHRTSRTIFIRESKKIDPIAYKKWLGIIRTVGKELESFFTEPIDAPTLTVMGSQDHIFLGPAREYAERFPDQSDLEVIIGCGHVCNIEAADRFNVLAIDFLRNSKQQSQPGFPKVIQSTD
jgi:pimeloyl-ACP methyl ester carboxylesterase